jgi:hypothetical protein
MKQTPRVILRFAAETCQYGQYFYFRRRKHHEARMQLMMMREQPFRRT